jgi:hypothetical protein
MAEIVIASLKWEKGYGSALRIGNEVYFAVDDNLWFGEIPKGEVIQQLTPISNPQSRPFDVETALREKGFKVLGGKFELSGLKGHTEFEVPSEKEVEVLPTCRVDLPPKDRFVAVRINRRNFTTDINWVLYKRGRDVYYLKRLVELKSLRPFRIAGISKNKRLQMGIGYLYQPIPKFPPVRLVDYSWLRQNRLLAFELKEGVWFLAKEHRGYTFTLKGRDPLEVVRKLRKEVSSAQPILPQLFEEEKEGATLEISSEIPLGFSRFRLLGKIRKPPQEVLQHLEKENKRLLLGGKGITQSMKKRKRNP